MSFRRVFYPDFVLDSASGFALLVDSLSPTSWWRLGEGSGTTAVDEQGLNNGTYTGSITLGSAGLVTGDANTAITINSTTAYVDLSGATTAYADMTNGFSALCITDLVSINAGGFSCPFGFKSSGTYPFIFCYSNVGGYSDISWGIASGGDGSMHATATVTNQLMALLTYSGTAYTLYINGTVVSTVGGSNFAARTNASRLGDLPDGGNVSLNGVLDEVAVWTGTVLTATDAMDLAVAAGYA